jgi:hypothetical protein
MNKFFSFSFSWCDCLLFKIPCKICKLNVQHFSGWERINLFKLNSTRNVEAFFFLCELFCLQQPTTQWNQPTLQHPRNKLRLIYQYDLNIFYCLSSSHHIIYNFKFSLACLFCIDWKMSKRKDVKRIVSL